MKVDLKKYMEERDGKRELNVSPGPVITISREHGCDAMSLAQKLIGRISEEQDKEWNCINKEILEEAANELHVTKSKISTVMSSGNQVTVSDMFASFSQHYGATDKEILETIKDILLSHAEEGNTIIVGRGGAHIARSIKQSLHIRLHASFDWRVHQTESKFGLSLMEAKTQCHDLDEKRNTWNKQLDKGNVSNAIYDISFNCETLSEDEMVDIVVNVLKSRKMI